VFGDIGEYLQMAHYERFQREETPEGEKWKELSPAYKARKERNADKILKLQETMFDTMHHETTAESLLFGSNLPYAATHQFGRGLTVRKKSGKVFNANIPARPFIGLSGRDGNEVKRLLDKWLLG
jgi:phage virion morphogenesis protein